MWLEHIFDLHTMLNKCYVNFYFFISYFAFLLCVSFIVRPVYDRTWQEYNNGIHVGMYKLKQNAY